MNDASSGPGKTETDDRLDADVCVVGAGPAGLTCAIFTARAGLDTVVVDGGPSILERNAHLENVPGFPGGVDARRFLGGTREQARDAGARIVDDRVEGVTRAAADGRLVATTADRTIVADSLVAASWKDCAYLDSLDVETTDRGTKTFLETHGDGRTSAESIYAAGRIAGQRHQTVIAAGHGADVGITVAHDAGVPFYHDWVTPDGYFSERDREVPPGCEEIDDVERREREAAGRERQRGLLDDEPTPPRTHPSLRDEEP
jgi:thioredoxin reductase (NADPH)